MRLLLFTTLLLMGCHTRLRVASPQITRRPDVVTCIVVVDTQQNVDVVKLAADVCKSAIQDESKP
jgi:hypothetical protein